MENVKKDNKTIILVVIGLLLALLIAIGIGYKLRVGNPVKLTTTALERLGKGIDKRSNLGRLLNFMEDADAYELNMSGDVTLPMEYGTVALDMLVQEDVEDQEAVIELDVKLNDESALYLEGQLDRNALYYAFQKNASKYYYMNDLKYPEIDELDYEDLLDYVTKSIEEVVKKEDFVESEKTITVSGKELKAKQYSLDLTEKLMAEITNKVIDKIVNDADMVESLAEFSSVTESEMRDNLVDSKISRDDLEELSSEAESVYNIYVAKNKAVRYELAEKANPNNNFYIDNYKYIEIGANLKDDYEEDIVVSIKENKDNWTVNVDSTELTVTGTISEEKYNLTVTAEGMSIIIAGTQDYKFARNNVELIEKGNIKMAQDGASIEIPYEFNIDLKEIQDVTKKNIKNKVDINNMTEAEQNEFTSELMNIPLTSMLMGDLFSGDSNDMISNSTNKDYLETKYQDRLREAEEYAREYVANMREYYGDEESFLQSIRDFGYSSVEEYEKDLYWSYLEGLEYEEKMNY